ncbi:hypothetical protein V6N13_101544 [Hibiscus sabdariffa]
MSADFKIPSFISAMLRDGTYASIGVEVPWLPVSVSELCCFRDVVVSVHVVFVPDVPSEVVAPSVVVPTTTDVAIVEGTNASASGNEGPLDLGVVQIPITGERGKAPLESIDNLDDGNEHKPIREAAKNVAVMMQGLKKNKKNAKKISDQSVTCLVRDGDASFYVTGACGCNLGSDRQRFWHHLLDLKAILKRLNPVLKCLNAGKYGQLSLQVREKSLELEQVQLECLSANNSALVNVYGEGCFS